MAIARPFVLTNASRAKNTKVERTVADIIAEMDNTDQDIE